MSVHADVIVTPQRRTRIRKPPGTKHKVYGHIAGISPGAKWSKRIDCNDDGVHPGIMNGISGNTNEGAYSIALSGGYEDDEDGGNVFTYTGSGGRDRRMGTQTADQTFDHVYNKILKASVYTKNPVRVIRGFNLDSPYAPYEGYRYDGLYIVIRAWMEIGKSKKQMCRFEFRRCPGQPPIPRQQPYRPKHRIKKLSLVSGIGGSRTRETAADKELDDDMGASEDIISVGGAFDGMESELEWATLDTDGLD